MHSTFTTRIELPYRVLILGFVLFQSCTIFDASHPELETNTLDADMQNSTEPDLKDRVVDLLTTEDQSSDAMVIRDQFVQPDMFVPFCSCVDPAATCSANGRCTVPDGCDLLNLCSGVEYICEDTTCVCIDDALCGQICETSGDCLDLDGLGSGCFDGKCRKFGDPCFNQQDQICPADTECRLALNDGTLTCAERGELRLGDDCLSSRECASLYCATNICINDCLTNQDCPVGEFCGVPPNQQLPACTVLANNCSGMEFSLENGDCEKACFRGNQCAGRCEFEQTLGFSICQGGVGQTGCPVIVGSIRSYLQVNGQCIDPTRTCLSNSDCDNGETCTADPNTVGHCRQ